MDIKDYILWGGGALIGLVVLHGLWMALRPGRFVEQDAEADDVDPQADLQWNGHGTEASGPTVASKDAGPGQEEASQGAGIGALSLPAAPAPALDAGRDDSVVAAPAVDLGRAEPHIDADTHVGTDTHVDSVPGEADILYSEDDPAATPSKRGRRLMIPGKRTEPTVRRTSRQFDALQAQRAEAEEKANGLDDIVVIWVVAKPGATLEGHGLLGALTANHLQYGGNVFRKLDPNTSVERYKVANGVEPGTFDLSDLDALSTPRIVMLLRFSPRNDPAEAFEDMLEVAQDIAASLDAELKDEQMSDMSNQTIEHCRQRIREHKRMSIRK